MITNDFAGWFIVLCWTAMILYWITTALSVKRTVERHSWMWQRVIVYSAIAALFVLYWNGYAGPILWTRTLAIGITADITTLFGLLIQLWARTSLGRNWSADVTFKEKHELIDRGPYRFIRHPIYSGLLLLILGTALWHGHVDGFIILILISVGVYVRARQEERLLAKHFPESYPPYKKRTTMFIPFIV